MPRSPASPEMAAPQANPANSQPAVPAVPAQPAAAVPRVARAARAPSVEAETPKKTLAEIFKDDVQNGSDESPAGETASDPTTPPDTIDALVKRLGLTHDQVYAIKVAMPGGAEPLSLGEIKDRISKVVDFEQRELQFDQRRVKQEGELLRSQSELRELLSLLPKGSVSPEIVNKMRERHNVTMKRERELTLEHIPDWHDESRMATEVDGMAKWLTEEYGFDPSFITTIVDHRALKFVRDMFLRDGKIKAALAGVQTPQSRTQRPSSRVQPDSRGRGSVPARPGASQPNRPAATPTERDRLSSVFNK